jgi:hypothetical protein
MAAYTTALLLSSIERKSFAPDNQATFETSDILAIADEVTKNEILPAILEAREEFFSTYKDYSITASQGAYAIPARAIGMIAREVHVVDSGGNVRNLPRVSVDRLHMLSATTGAPEAFYLRGNNIVLYPTPSATEDTLRVYYFLRPADLVETTSTDIISAINTSTNVVTVSTIPSTWVTGDIFDFTKKDGAHEPRGIEFTSSNITSTAITFSSLPSDLAVGDYVSITGQTSLVQLPPDFQPILADFVAAEMLLNMSQPGGKELYEKAMKRLEAAQRLITPRVLGEDEIILPDWD